MPMLLNLLAFLLPATPIDYAAHYGQAYQEALVWIAERQTLVEKRALAYDLEADVLLAVVFPELLRYAEWRDLLETEALGLTYVEGGTAWPISLLAPFK